MTWRAPAILLAAFTLTVSAPELPAQAAWVDQGPLVSGGLVALRQDDYFSSAWTPGIGLGLEVPLLGVLSGRLSATGTWTHRREEIACPGVAVCPDPERVSGWMASGIVSIEARLPVDEDQGFVLGVGYGRVWDVQPGGMFEYEGPAWAWDVRFQRVLGARSGLELGYRLLRVSWDTRFDILRGTRFHYHQASVGMTFWPGRGGR